MHRAFRGFGQAKFADGGSILGSSQFTQLPLLPLKITLNLKKAKINSKIIILRCQSKSVTQFVRCLVHLAKNNNKSTSFE